MSARVSLRMIGVDERADQHADVDLWVDIFARDTNVVEQKIDS
jgi:hypothetical protein